MAERAGFEPARARKGPTRFPGVPVRPLQHLSDQIYGGEGGIRTHGTRKDTPLFESDALNRSATSPLEGLSVGYYTHDNAKIVDRVKQREPLLGVTTPHEKLAVSVGISLTVPYLLQ